MKTDKDTAASAEFPECRAHHWDYAERLCSAGSLASRES